MSIYPFRLFGAFCTIVLFIQTSFSQFALFGDIYIAPQNEVHLLSGDLYFESGKIITDRGAQSGTFSFSGDSGWDRADHDTHVDGFIRFYNASEFVFPVGHDNVLQPIRLDEYSGSDHFDIAYQHRGHDLTATVDGINQVSDTHFWELRNPTGQAKLVLSWNVFSNIDKLLGVAPRPDLVLDLITIGGFDGTHWVPIPSELSEKSLTGGNQNSLINGTIQST